VPGGDELDRVSDREEHAVLLAHADLPERIAGLVGEGGELRVRALPAAFDERGAAAAPLFEITVQEVRGDVVPCRRARLVAHGPGSGRTCSRISSTSRAASVPSVASP